MIIDHFELSHEENLSVDERRKLKGIEIRIKENNRLKKQVTPKMLDWYKDPMILPPGSDKLKYYKAMAAGIIQTVHDELSEIKKSKFTIKPFLNSTASAAIISETAYLLKQLI